MTPPSVCARRAGLVFGCVLLSVIPASAQLLAAKDGPIVYGHHHVNVTSVDAHKKLWIDALGGTAVKIGASPRTEIVKFPNVLVFLTAAARRAAARRGRRSITSRFETPDLRKLRLTG